ncbi:DUF2177 family protein [bacterium]|nr:DUF2177 family protein [bacterium]
MRSLLAAVTTLLLLLIGDAVWLGAVAKTFYRTHIGWLLAESPNFVAAGSFYVLYGIGVSVFVVEPALSANSSPMRAAAMGALFGLVAYATYDLTNQSTVKNWPLLVTVVDLAWGAFLTAAVSVGATLIIRRFFS